MSVKDVMAVVDARILNSPIVKDKLLIGSTEFIGAFTRDPILVDLPGGGVEGVETSFACRANALFNQLEPGTPVQIEGHGYFRLLREILPGGDESGLTVLELGDML